MLSLVWRGTRIIGLLQRLYEWVLFVRYLYFFSFRLMMLYAWYLIHRSVHCLSSVFCFGFRSSSTLLSSFHSHFSVVCGGDMLTGDIRTAGEQQRKLIPIKVVVKVECMSPTRCSIYTRYMPLSVSSFPNVHAQLVVFLRPK
jgi:hypothetical protein